MPKFRSERHEPFMPTISAQGEIRSLLLALKADRLPYRVVLKNGKEFFITICGHYFAQNYFGHKDDAGYRGSGVAWMR